MNSTSVAAQRSQYVTVPNLISVTRLAIAPVLLALAAHDWTVAFLGLAVTLLMTDWIDGRLARAWNQQTAFGARLDAACDVAIYAFIAWGIWVLKPDVFWDLRYGLAVVVLSYLLSMVVCLFKFGCLPNYHTRLSKLSWLMVTVGVIVLLLGLSAWPMWLAFAVVTAANFESMAVTFTLRRWRADVRSVAEARRLNAALPPEPRPTEVE
jgi:CDP-diacylglycerol--glycerol-3-phosphate 3-phosphatidyltransferase